MLVNQWMGTGNLGRDPDMSYTPSGKAVTKFSIAVFQSNQPTMWLNIVCWDALAERVNEKVRKGNEVFVQGRLTARKYTDKNGIERTAFEVIAMSVQLTQKAQSAAVTSDDDDPLGEMDEHPF